MQLQVASKKKAKIKMAISSPTGFGKTYSALLLAYGITNDWSKIAVIDTENESASLYSDLGDYKTIAMQPPYTVDSFVEAVKLCVSAGIEVIIIDSTYHYWHGKGGLLERHNALSGNSYTNWAKTNPLYSKWLDTILQTPVHFICTSRKKQAYEMTKDADGKLKVEKKGMEDQIRDGFDYEMTLAFNIVSDNHLVEVNKDRTRLFAGKQEFVITPTTGQLIKQWCETGIEAAAIKPATNGLPTNNQSADFYEQWQKEVSAMDKQEKLNYLYEINKSTVDADEKLKEMFKAKQTTFKTTKA